MKISSDNTGHCHLLSRDHWHCRVAHGPGNSLVGPIRMSALGKRESITIIARSFLLKYWYINKYIYIYLYQYIYIVHYSDYRFKLICISVSIHLHMCLVPQKDIRYTCTYFEMYFKHANAHTCLYILITSHPQNLLSI